MTIKKEIQKPITSELAKYRISKGISKADIRKMFPGSDISFITKLENMGYLTRKISKKAYKIVRAIYDNFADSYILGIKEDKKCLK